MVSGGWCNSVALPIVLLLALCEQDAMSAVERCAERSLSYLLVYTVPWTVLFFVLGLPLLQASSSRPVPPQNRVSACAARTLNTTGQSRVTLSLQ